MLLMGRINRTTYWLTLGVLVLALAGFALLTHRRLTTVEGILVFVCVPRLHDIGRSGWWVLLGVGLEVAAIAVGLLAFPPEQSPEVMGATVLVIFALLAWLGAIPGDREANRFGDRPKPWVSLGSRTS